MQIGNITVSNNVFLAPMAGVTDLVYRILCKEQGCGLVYSEMVSAKGILYDNENTKKLLDTNIRERPTAIQIFGSEPKILAKAAEKLNDYPIDIIDINMGCPAPKIVKNGEGAALMKNVNLIGEIVYAVSSSSNKPVTIKIRKGFDDNSINAVDAAIIAEKNGASAIAIHGRTREEYYSGNADWDIIKKVKQNISIPVIGNGDINSPQKALEMFNYTKCDAVMIGRAAAGNPWIFNHIISYIKNKEIIPEPNISQKIDMAIKHLYMLVKYKGEYIGVREMRKHLGWYIKGMPHSAEARVLINKIDNENDMKNILLKLKEYHIKSN